MTIFMLMNQGCVCSGVFYKKMNIKCRYLSEYTFGDGVYVVHMSDHVIQYDKYAMHKTNVTITTSPKTPKKLCPGTWRKKN